MELLGVINVENNRLSGALPSEVGLLSTLFALHLGNTTITGSVPSGVCSVQDLIFDCSDTLCGCACDCRGTP